MYNKIKDLLTTPLPSDWNTITPPEQFKSLSSFLVLTLSDSAALMAHIIVKSESARGRALK